MSRPASLWPHDGFFVLFLFLFPNLLSDFLSFPLFIKRASIFDSLREGSFNKWETKVKANLERDSERENPS